MSTMNKTKIGFAKTVITPSIGTQLTGPDHLNRPAKEIHDDLFTRAVVLEFEGEDYCLIQNDLAGLDYDFVESIKGELVSLGIKDTNIFIGCTHTHSGPKGLCKSPVGSLEYFEPLGGIYNEALCLNIQKAIIEGVRQALANKLNCYMRYGTKEVYDVCSNRNKRDEPGDPLLLAIEFIREDGKKILFYNFSCHPTIVNRGSYQVSADFPHGVAKLSEGLHYDLVMFTNGSSGDISTRFTRKEASFGEIDRIGKLLWQHIQDALSEAKSQEIRKVATKELVFNVTLKPLISVDSAREKLEYYRKRLEEAEEKGLANIRSYESFIEGAEFNLNRALCSSEEKTSQLNYKFLQLNDLVFVFVPVEMFSDLTNALKSEYQEKLFFCTIFNGFGDYLADESSYKEDTYETQSSRYQQGQGEAFIENLKVELKNFAI